MTAPDPSGPTAAEVFHALRTDGTPAAMLADHLAACHEADALLVVDGSADEIIARLVAAGWTLSDEPPEITGGKRIRMMTPPRPIRAPRWACPECASPHVEHERGLLFCGGCGHTWPLDPDREDL